MSVRRLWTALRNLLPYQLGGAMATSLRRTWIERMKGAALLDVDTYE
jgi:hypothetical protein